MSERKGASGDGQRDVVWMKDEKSNTRPWWRAWELALCFACDEMDRLARAVVKVMIGVTEVGALMRPRTRVVAAVVVLVGCGMEELSMAVSDDADMAGNDTAGSWLVTGQGLQMS